MLKAILTIAIRGSLALAFCVAPTSLTQAAPSEVAPAWADRGWEAVPEKEQYSAWAVYFRSINQENQKAANNLLAVSKTANADDREWSNAIIHDVREAEPVFEHLADLASIYSSIFEPVADPAGKSIEKSNAECNLNLRIAHLQLRFANQVVHLSITEQRGLAWAAAVDSLDHINLALSQIKTPALASDTQIIRNNFQNVSEKLQEWMHSKK